jgi:hypothetical protein
MHNALLGYLAADAFDAARTHGRPARLPNPRQRHRRVQRKSVFFSLRSKREDFTKRLQTRWGPL